MVWEGVLRKTKFLEHRSPQEIRAFQCLQGKIILMGLKVKDPTIDLTTKDGFKRIQTNTPTLSVYNSEKLYSRKREEEMFDLIQSGAIISDGNLFKTIALMVADES